MAYDYSIERYRNLYSKLLHFYPQPYRERFIEEMQQTFNDLCRERTEVKKGLLGFLLWTFTDTAIAIIKQNITFITMQNITKRLTMWALGVTALLLIPLTLSIQQRGMENPDWGWTGFDFVFMGILLFGAALAYELIVRRITSTVYKAAVALAGVTSVVLIWINASVGIIGDGPINLMYFGVLAVGFLGSLISWFDARKMSYTMYAMTGAQLLVPVIALIVGTSDFSPSVSGVFGLNGFFALMFAGSAILFQKASVENK